MAINDVTRAGDQPRAAPPAPGYTPQGLFQAVPTDTGPSLYSVQAATGAIQTLVQAFTSDGQQLWQTALNSSCAGFSAPDGNGGMIVASACDRTNSIPLTLIGLACISA